MTHPPPLLVVDDEDHLARGLKLNFELEGFAVDTAGTIRAATQRLAERGPYAAIVLDIELPDGMGFDLCQRLRDAGDTTPIVMLTVRSDPADRVLGLESGADDYLPKPFAFAELLARVRAMLRRRRWDAAPTAGAAASAAAELRFGDVHVDFATHEVTAYGARLELTALELSLLRYFAAHPQRVLSREELLEKVWELPTNTNTRTVDNFIVRLRRYFEEDPSNPRYFLSVRGAGYRFVGLDAPL